MSAQHTPGPWAVSRRASRRVTTDKGVVICTAVLRNSGSAKRGIRHGAKEAPEAEANARMIAAAPELLEALELLVKRCGPNASDGAIARAAIAKARGEAQKPAGVVCSNCGKPAHTKYDGDDLCRRCAEYCARRDFEEGDMPGGVA